MLEAVGWLDPGFVWGFVGTLVGGGLVLLSQLIARREDRRTRAAKRVIDEVDASMNDVLSLSHLMDWLIEDLTTGWYGSWDNPYPDPDEQRPGAYYGSVLRLRHSGVLPSTTRNAADRMLKAIRRWNALVADEDDEGRVSETEAVATAVQQLVAELEQARGAQARRA